MTINDVFVVNVAEDRGPFAVQSGTFKDYTADLALDGDINNVVDRPPHCAHPIGESGHYAWWMVDLGTQYTVDSVTIYSSSRKSGNTTALITRSHLLLNMYCVTLLKIILIHYVFEFCMLGTKLLHFQDEYALGHISIRVSDNADISEHTESQECAKWNQEEFPQSTSQTLNCSSVLEGRYVSIQRTNGERTHSMIVCEVFVMGVIGGMLPCMFHPKPSSGYNLFLQAIIENNSYIFLILDSLQVCL